MKFSAIARKHGPLTTVVLSPKDFVETWRNSPTEDVCIGLRRLSEIDLQKCVAMAERAVNDEPTMSDEQRTERYNSFLLCWLIGTAHCDPNDAEVPSLLGMWGDDAALWLRPEALRRLFDEWEVAKVQDSPIWEEATDAVIADVLQAVLDGTLDSLPASEQAKVRKLFTFLSDKLCGLSD